MTDQSSKLSLISSSASTELHTELLHFTDQDLKEMAPEATHQHKKGGLYRLLGPARSSETGKIARDDHCRALVAYEHLLPYKREIWLRPSSEFFDGRFRELRP